MKDLFYQKTNDTVILLFGGGQDSWAILTMFINDELFRKTYAPNNLLVVMSDTGWEHPKTYIFNSKARQLCLDNDIEFYVVERWMGYHPNTWQTLTHNWELNQTIGSVAFPQTCTDNIKIKPVKKFVADWLRQKYGYDGKRTSDVYKQYYYEHGTLTHLIGFADKEQSRAKGYNGAVKWEKECLDYEYPLIDLEIDRAQAQEVISNYGYEVPPPSNCTICFYMSRQEILWLYRNLPNDFWYWVKLERAKINKHRLLGLAEPKNQGPFGKKTIIQKTKEAIKQYGHLTSEELEDYKFSHGHCTKSKF